MVYIEPGRPPLETIRPQKSVLVRYPSGKIINCTFAAAGNRHVMTLRISSPINEVLPVCIDQIAVGIIAWLKRVQRRERSCGVDLTCPRNRGILMVHVLLSVQNLRQSYSIVDSDPTVVGHPRITRLSTFRCDQ